MQSIRAWWSRGVNEVRHPDKTIFCFLYRWNLLREIKRCCEVDFATFGHYQVSCFPHASSSYAKLTVSLQLQTSSLIPGSWLGLAPTLRLKTLIIHVFKKSFKKIQVKKLSEQLMIPRLVLRLFLQSCMICCLERYPHKVETKPTILQAS